VADDLSDRIDEVAAGPAEVDADGVKVVAQPLPDLIQADKYRRGADAASGKARGLRFTKLTPPGAV
jgi:hypothetical protein